MTTRTRVLGAAAVVVVLGGLMTVPSVAAASTPTALSLPQATAFSFLGHSCGGIQEQILSTGFDPTSGFPAGDVYLQTRCGGSGRGGGYHTTTYSAWVGVTWDFTSAVVSSVALPTAPTGLDPTLTAVDPSGNQMANTLNAVNVVPSSCTVGNTTYCTYRASLTLASGFTPQPRVTGLSIAVGPAVGGTSVTITGTGFTAVSGVSFGGTPAAGFTVAGDTAITATTPVVSGSTVDVTVTSAGGTSQTIAADQFTFVEAPSVVDVSPNTGPVLGGTSVTITGSHLGDATVVSFGGIATGFTVSSDSSIVAVTPAAEGADTVDVTVTSMGGTSATGASASFTYTAGVQCAKLSGIASGTMTISKCTPKSGANKKASLVAQSGTMTWSASGQTTIVNLDGPVSPGQGACGPGRIEYDISGTVTGGTSTYTSVGDAVAAQTCVSASGKVSLVTGTTYSL